MTVLSIDAERLREIIIRQLGKRARSKEIADGIIMAVTEAAGQALIPTPVPPRDRHKYVAMKCEKCGNERIRRADTKAKSCDRCRRLTHGMWGHPLYEVWRAMIRRCGLKNGGKTKYKGITVCQEWQADRTAFFDWALANGWQEGLTLDRRDNLGDYTPENCRFVTCAVNSQNRKTAVLDEDKVRTIREMIKKDMSRSTIARHFGVSVDVVGSVIRNERWSNIQ